MAFSNWPKWKKVCSYPDWRRDTLLRRCVGIISDCGPLLKWAHAHPLLDPSHLRLVAHPDLTRPLLKLLIVAHLPRPDIPHQLSHRSAVCRLVVRQ